MRRIDFTGKTAARTMMATALAAMLLGPGFHRTGAAMAAEGGVELRQSVQVTVNFVKLGDSEAFDAWIADFRANVETLIAEGKLSPTDICAYRSWRVLGPVEGARRQSTIRPEIKARYLFIFDPLVSGADYSLQAHLTTALGEEEAVKRIEAFQAMLADEPETYLVDPLATADAIDRSTQCEL